MKKNYDIAHGVTLITLTITIIVLLILAGVAIIILNSNDSILNKATQSLVIQDKESIREIILMAVNNVKIEKATNNLSKEKIINMLKNEIEILSNENTTVEFAEGMYVIKLKSYEFKINEDLTFVSKGISNERIIIEKSFTNEIILADLEGGFREHTAIKIEFDQESINPNINLNIYMFDSNNNFIKSYSRSNLLGKTIYVNDNGVKFKLQNWNEVSDYTFRCIVTQTDELEYAGKETLNSYKPNSEYVFTNVINDAEQIEVKFSDDSVISSNDSIDIYSFIQYSETNFGSSIERTILPEEVSSKKFIVSRNNLTMVLSSGNGETIQKGNIKYTLEKYVTPDNVLESKHGRESNLQGKVYEKMFPDAKRLELKFDEDTNLNKRFDSLYVYYTTNENEEILVGKFTGNDLSNAILQIPSNNVKFILYTGGSLVNCYGFRCEITQILNE